MQTPDNLRKQQSNQRGYTIQRIIAAFLSDTITCKEPQDRTKREELLVETGKAFISQLDAYEKQPNSIDRMDEEIAPVLATYNEIHRAYDLRNADAQVIDRFRKPAL